MSSCKEDLVQSLSKANLNQVLPQEISSFMSLEYHGIIQLLKQKYARPSPISSVVQLNDKLRKHQVCNLKKTTTIGICTVTDGTFPNFQQWLANYVLLGVTNITVFDSTKPNSPHEDKLLKDISPFVDHGILSHKKISSVDISEKDISTECHLSYNSTVQWVSFIDSDEFLVLNAAEPCLEDILRKYPTAAALEIPQLTISPLGVPVYNHSESLLSQYRHAAGYGKDLKYLTNMKYFRAVIGNHEIAFSEGKRPVKYTGAEMNRINENYDSRDEFHLRHYWGGDLVYAVFEKVCGTSAERRKQYHVNQQVLLEMMIHHPGKLMDIPLFAFSLNQFLFE
jgi:hypothetical protein